MPKMKTNSAASKRVRVTGSGKLMHAGSAMRHNLEHKSARKRRALKADGVLATSQSKNMKKLIEAASAGALTLEKLEAMTCVCSVGLDMIAIPGDTSAAAISGIIADEAAIGMVNNKTTAVRVIPAVGKKAGDTVEFGGLLGFAPVMPVNPYGNEEFVARGGRIPAPLHSLRN